MPYITGLLTELDGVTPMPQVTIEVRAVQGFVSLGQSVGVGVSTRITDPTGAFEPILIDSDQSPRMELTLRRGIAGYASIESRYLFTMPAVDTPIMTILEGAAGGVPQDTLTTLLAETRQGYIPVSPTSPVSSPVTIPDGTVDGQLIGYSVRDVPAVIDGTTYAVGDGPIFEWYASTSTWTLRQAGSSGGGGDTTAPTAGTLSSSAVTDASFTLTVSGASDETALAAAPYAFSTDNGSTFSTFQASASYAATGRTPSTGYQCIARVKDAAGNTSDTPAITVTTSATVAPITATYLGSFASGADQATYTYSGAPLGTASASRRILVVAGWRGTASQGAPTVTVAGVTAPFLYSGRDNTIGVPLPVGKISSGWLANDLSMWVADVPTGATGDIVVSLTAIPFRFGMAVWALDGSPVVVSDEYSDTTSGATTTLTSAATAAQTIVGAAFANGATMTLTPTGDAVTPAAAEALLGAWHVNGTDRTQDVTLGSSTGGRAIQAVIEAA